MEELAQEIQDLKDEVRQLRQDIHQLARTCGRMDNHISFVDSVYETVRHPIQSIINRLYPSVEMPVLEYDEDLED
jgi:prefoldin subunit 5